MTVNASSTNTMSYTTTAAVHEKPSESIEKEFLNYSKNYQNSIANVAADDDSQKLFFEEQIITVSLH